MGVFWWDCFPRETSLSANFPREHTNFAGKVLVSIDTLPLAPSRLLGYRASQFKSSLLGICSGTGTWLPEVMSRGHLTRYDAEELLLLRPSGLHRNSGSSHPPSPGCPYPRLVKQNVALAPSRRIFQNPQYIFGNFRIPHGTGIPVTHELQITTLQNYPPWKRQIDTAGPEQLVSGSAPSVKGLTESQTRSQQKRSQERTLLDSILSKGVFKEKKGGGINY